MATDDDYMEFFGTIEECLPNNQCRVKLDNVPGDKLVLCYMSGKLKMNNIKVIAGDEVTVAVSVADLGRGRIVYRGKKQKRDHD